MTDHAYVARDGFRVCSRCGMVQTSDQATDCRGALPRITTRSRSVIALELLKCAISWEPEARLLGDVTALEIGQLVAGMIPQCPRCGTEAWCNISCDLCLVCGALEHGESP